MLCFCNQNLASHSYGLTCRESKWLVESQEGRLRKRNAKKRRLFHMFFLHRFRCNIRYFFLMIFPEGKGSSKKEVISSDVKKILAASNYFLVSYGSIGL